MRGQFLRSGKFGRIEKNSSHMHVSEIFDNVDLHVMFKVPRCLIHIAMVLTTGVRSCGSAATSVPKIMH